MKYKHFKQALLFKVDSILNFRMWGSQEKLRKLEGS